jgi:hypothetical protein
MSNAVEMAEEAERRAMRAMDAILGRKREEKRLAEAGLNERFREELASAFEVLSEARAELRDAKDRLPDHPWAGKRVFRMALQGPSYLRRPAKRIEGIVETRRSTTEFPGNTASYRKPQIGQGFVRLLKNDGTPGAKFELLGHHGEWKLVDEAAVADTSDAPLGPGMNK